MCGAVVLLVVIVAWFVLSGGDGLPDTVAGRPSIDLDLGRGDLAPFERMGVSDPAVRAYGTAEVVEIAVLRGTVEDGFDLPALLRTAAAFGGTRVPMSPIPSPTPWSCMAMSGGARLWPGVAASDARVCHIVEDSHLLAFIVVGAVDLADVASDLD